MKPVKEINLNYKELIPKLIQKSKSLSKEIRKRMKLNHIFSEFENKASNQFNFFIKESEKRYLGSKYGTKIEYLLKSSQKRGKKEAYKILNDNFYLNPDILNERKKMQKKSTNEIHQNITDIINRLKGIKSEDFDKNNNDLLKFEKLNGDKEQIKKNKNEINYILDKEQNTITQSFDKYKKVLSNIEPTVKKASTEEEEENERIKNNKIKKTIYFEFPKMKLLNYTKVFSHKKTKKDEDDENRINIKKLIPYSISGKTIFPKERKICLINPLLSKKNPDLFTRNSTNAIVIKNAINEYNSFKKYYNKDKEISKQLAIGSVPSLTLYEQIIKSDFNKIKLERNKYNNKIYNNQKIIGLNPKQRLNQKIQDNLDYLNNFEKNLKKYNNTVSIY